MTNQIVSTNGSKIAELAEQFKALITNGKALTDIEARALAQYSAATDLNPFAGECYYLPGIGPGPGIAGWRKKATEQLEYEANKARQPVANFWCDYVDASPKETGNVTSGDIAVKAVLHDSLSKSEWEKRRLSYFVELIKAKMSYKEADEASTHLAGSEPTWSAIGIVRASENFGSQEKFSRYERACKRAEKLAIRKRFPRVNLPEPIGFDEDVVDVTAVDITETSRDENQVMSELGFDSQPEKPAAELLMTCPPELKEIEGICDSNGAPYWSIATEKLSFMYNSLRKHSPASDDDQRKMGAINKILAWRNANPAA